METSRLSTPKKLRLENHYIKFCMDNTKQPFLPRPLMIQTLENGLKRDLEIIWKIRRNQVIQSKITIDISAENIEFSKIQTFKTLIRGVLDLQRSPSRTRGY